MKKLDKKSASTITGILDEAQEYYIAAIGTPLASILAVKKEIRSQTK